MQTTRVRRILLHSLSFLCIAFAPAAMANLVTNGGFETGDFTGWTVNDPSGFTVVGNDPAFAHSGNDKAYLGASGLLGSLSQNLATMAGTSYTLDFFMTNDGGVPPNEFDVLWNGNTIFSSVNSPNNPNYTELTFNVLATGASTALQFKYRNDAEFFRLDDVSVNVAGVPDSGSALLLALPVVGALVLFDRSVRRRRRIFA